MRESILRASQICVSGGYVSGAENISPVPFVDCPRFEDPLASRVEPNVSGCDKSLPTEVSDVRTLEPGAYCGLKIKAGGVVTMEPGVYSFIGAPLVVEDGAELFGKGVGLHFVGSKASLYFATHSMISLEAPTKGELAGLLVFGSRQQGTNTRYDIFSVNAQRMVGTIYIPVGELRIDGDAKVGGDSAYTAIVVRRFTTYGGPHVVLNSSYEKTDVPVPDGIRGAGQPVRLIQ
jgi:hypothetical protein